MKVYGLSGLGADERVFHAINAHLERPIINIPWIKPLGNESLRAYAHRLSETIDSSESFALVGVSFGGMIASEMNKVISPERTILISSASRRSELPAYFRGAGKLNIVPHVPSKMIQLPDAFMKFLSPVKDPKQRDLFIDIAKRTDREFLKWAVQSILTWDNDVVPERLRRIHGSKDRLLPMRSKADVILEGGHLVILEKAREMAEAIERELSTP